MNNTMSIEDYAFGQDFVCPETPPGRKKRPTLTGAGVTRARKVTVTEITEEIDDWEMVSGSSEEESSYDEEDGSLCEDSSVSYCTTDDEEEAEEEEDEDVESAVMRTDEAFGMLDDLVADWKSKLEAAVGEGLKKLRKNGKEKRMMAKYLPGDDASNNVLDEAKAAIVKVLHSNLL